MTTRASSSAPLDQDALYYPYTTVSDATWLKGALLCFPHIYRMIPTDFKPSDNEYVAPFARTKGTRDEPLLGAIAIDYRYAFPEQAYIYRRIESDIEAGGETFLRRFSVESAIADYDEGQHAFQLYRPKVFDELFGLLDRYKLIWKSEKPTKGGPEWYAMHPVLGEALMSTVGVAIARTHGLHIVTSSEPKHRELFMHSTEEIYDSLVHRNTKPSELTKPELAYRLAQLVIVSYFNVDSLTPEAIVKVSKETTAFRDLKNKLIAESDVADTIVDPDTINNRLKAAAGRIIAEWEASKPTRSKFLKSFFSLGLLNAGESALTEAAKAAVLGTFGGVGAASLGVAADNPPIVLAVAPGLAVAVVYYGIATARKQFVQAKESPYRFLTKIEKSGALFTASPAVAGSALK